MFRAFVVFIACLAPLSLVCEAVCDTFPPDLWLPRAAFEASQAGKPTMGVPPIGAGFNRTVNLDGFCNDIIMSSDLFKCSDESTKTAKGEFFASPKVAGSIGSFLRFDDVNCPLSGITIRKTPAGAVHEAEIRFEFEKCVAAAESATASPVDSAAVVMGLRKVSVGGSNMLPWMKEACNVAIPKDPNSVIQVGTSMALVKVGQGQCKATGTADPTGTTEAACNAACNTIILQAEATKKSAAPSKEVCTGYAFSAEAEAGKQCMLYTTAVDAVDTPDSNWVCFSMALKDADYGKTQAAPNPVDALAALTQSIHIREVMAGAPGSMTSAQLMQVTSDEKCFEGAWWFFVQDDLGNPASLPVLETDWAAIMDMVPEPLTAQPATKSTVLLDTVLFKTCNPLLAGWGRECIVDKSVAVVALCDSAQIWNAVITGIVVPVFGWLIVYFVFTKLPTSCMTGGASREFRDHDSFDEGNIPTCATSGLLFCCFVGIVACGGLAYGSSALVSHAFGSQGCLHGERETQVIAVGAGVPGALCVVLGIFYVHLSAKKHASTQPAGETYAPQKGTKLMLVEVPDDGKTGALRGRPVNPDILQTGNSAMSSYNATQMPREINIDTMNADIGDFQSLGGGGSNFGSVRPGGE